MLDTPGDEQISGQIVARKLSSSRIEFGWLPSGSDDADRVLPSPRFFPANPTVDKWLSSGSVAGARSAIGHIEARRLHDGRTEFAFTPADQIERIYPNVRYFPADARVGRWLKSSEITFTPGPDDGGDEMDDGTDSQGGDELDTPTQPPPEPPTTPPATAGNRAISVGEAHNCAIRSSGAIECWGLNTSGQTNAPAGSFTAFSAGGSHTCAIRESGAIECWGRNYNEQSDAPAGSFTAVSAGVGHTCGLRTSGVIECWGSNDNWQSSAPTGSFSAVSAGVGYTCAIRSSDRAIMCWGDDRYGQSSAPTGSFSAVSAGGRHTCAIRSSDRAILCWGDNDERQINAPAGSFSAVSAGGGHTCGLRTSGVIKCWGSNRDWYDNYVGQSAAPAGSYSAVSAGSVHTCGLRSSGAIECWGLNHRGQADAPPGSYSTVSAGGEHTCGLRESGAIECWGSLVNEDELGGMNDDGEMNDDGDELGGMSDGGAGDQPTPEPRVGTGTSTTPLQRDASVTMDPTAAPLPPLPVGSEDTSYGYIVARLGTDSRIEFGWQAPSGAGYFPFVYRISRNYEHNRWLRSSPISVLGAEIGRINVRLSGDGGTEFAFTPTDGERIEPDKLYFPADAQVGIWLRTSWIILDDTAFIGETVEGGMSDE